MSRTVRVRERMRPGAVAVAWHDSAQAALERMRAAGLDAVPVVDGPRVIGLLERDAASAARGSGNWLGAVQVASLMRHGSFACGTADPVERARAAMDRLGVGLLAVVDEGGSVVGVIGRERATATLPALAAAS
jgi:CBS domain-containing protein